MDVERASASDAGCWIDGHWGQYGPARLVQIAGEYGWLDDATLLAARKLASMPPSGLAEISVDEEEALYDASDDAESWLNDNVAPEGYSFGWHDGEFFLMADADWGAVD